MTYRELQKQLKLARKLGRVSKSFKLNQKRAILQAEYDRIKTEKLPEYFPFNLLRRYSEEYLRDIADSLGIDKNLKNHEILVNAIDDKQRELKSWKQCLV